MSENDKDNADFEFIKEQVIENKRRKWKKRLSPLIMTITLAILFGLIAAVTFVIAEPRLYQLLNKNDNSKTPVNFPTITPEETNPSSGNTTDDSKTEDDTDGAKENQNQNIAVQKIPASLEDYEAIHSEIQGVVNEVDKSLLNITSMYQVDDWFGNAEKIVNTTGVIIASNSSQYLVLVSLDRVQDADHIKVKFSDTTYADAVIKDYETELNIALLSISLKDIPDLYLNGLQVAEMGESYALSVGSPVIAVGNPNGHTDSIDTGIVTSRGVYASITDNRIELFNTDMEEYESSDGVIINLDGKIVGLITRTLREDLNKDLSTAIGISKIKQTIIKMGNKEPRIYCGIKADDLTEDVRLQYDVTNGIYVNEVLPDSPAFEAGIRDGDIILDVNDQPILNTNNFYNVITSNKANQQITVKVKRTSSTSKKEVTIKVLLAEKPQ